MNDQATIFEPTNAQRTGALAQERGKAFENAVITTAKRYERERRLVIRKVDPPTSLVRGQLIRRRSPFLDFVGSWTERGGRAIFIEAKSKNVARLPLMNDSGLKEKQWESLRVWKWAGAIVGVLWRSSDGVVWIPYSKLNAEINAGSKSILARECVAIATDLSIDRIEFLPALAVE